jgi:hypothetical protein
LISTAAVLTTVACVQQFSKSADIISGHLEFLWAEVRAGFRSLRSGLAKGSVVTD